jgi:hypothetical protein
MFGESLCFAYTYAMVQMIEVALFRGKYIGTCILIIFAFILPTLQILKAIQNKYTIEMDHLYGELYMGKEIVLYLSTRVKSNRRIHSNRLFHDNVVSVIICVWVVLEIVFSFKDINTSYRTVSDKLLYIARFAPIFLMVVVNI